MGEICVGPTGNRQGTYKFMSLKTGKMIKRGEWTEVPITDEVIRRAIELGEAEKAFHGLKFNNNCGLIQEEYAPDYVDIAGVCDLTEDEEEGNEEEKEDHGDEDDEAAQEFLEEEDEYENNPDRIVAIEERKPTVVEDLEGEEEFLSGESPENTEEAVEDTNVNTEDNPNTYTTRSGRRVQPTSTYIPSTKGQKYDQTSLVQTCFMQTVKHILKTTCNTQHTLNAGIKKLGEPGIKAAMKEIEQLHCRNTFEPILAEDLTHKERRSALESLIFLKEKKDGSIKGRACADGRKQKFADDNEKGANASPTVSIESVLITAVIDALEERDVAVVDIPNAFVQTRMDDEKVIMKMRGKLVDLMCVIAPDVYTKYVTIENGVKVLYLCLLNALYGTLKAALLFYQKLVKDLEAEGFELNPYDLCVANKIINDKQMTLTWHVDDMKISHVEPQEVTIMIDFLRKKYASDGIGEMTISRGKRHNYLGMILDYSTKGEVHIDMQEYVKKMIEEFPEDIKKTAATPASDFLFKINEEAELLNNKMKEDFHTFVAKGLFLCKRARPDIQTTIAFLTTRVQKPDVDDWKKLKRLIMYLKGTEEFVLKLRAYNTKLLKWHVDASYAVHNDLRSHTGGNFTMGKGTIYGKSSKQKLNVKSSTEAELVGFDDCMPQILWTNYFIGAQGYETRGTIGYQDNRSAILLETNGRRSSSKRTKHLNVRYFFVTDRINNGDLSIKYCPNKEMVADFFTKPLQGEPFYKFRKEIMGHN